MSTQEGKIGLCLSGGGFRAALFHIGTLAALAERELLHEVEVLSTVSGGSIIGAYYYLKVKQLLEGRRPGCPTPQPEHYFRIVQEIERDFLDAVQKNMRMRLFLNPAKTAKMLLDEEYSRSDRLSELLNDYFYDHVALTGDIHLNAIHITPQNAADHPDDEGGFSVQKYNAAESCKIPVLTINATCLNTGHPWHFTGSWMGEPGRRIKYTPEESLYELEQNSNVILPQLRFDGYFQDDRSRRVDSRQLKKMNSILLSDAVAASAAVPAIFPPLPIHDLYRNSKGEEIVVELSDGGVFDNQGLDALFAAQCTRIIVSDASGQLEDEKLLATHLAQVAQRANDVMMERIRGYGYFDLRIRRDGCKKLPAADALRTEICFIENASFTHLRQTAPNTSVMPALPGPANGSNGVVYRLSGVRTDLDSFSDLEAYTLMYQGYSLALDRLSQAGMGNPPGATPLCQWRFLDIRPVIMDDLYRLTTHLAVGKQKFFKTFYLAPVESWAWLLFLLSPLILNMAFWLHAHWGIKIQLPQPSITGSDLFWYAAIALLALLPLSSTVRAWFKTTSWLRGLKKNPATDAGSKIIGIGMAVLSISAWLVVSIHLAIFNKLFLKTGKLR